MNEMAYYDLKGVTTMAPSLSSQIAREIGRRIVIGSFKEGAKLDDEFTLAHRYQVSRPIIRESVKILLNKGLVEVKRGTGTRIRKRSEWVSLDDDVLAWHLNIPSDKCRNYLLTLLEVRLTFEPKAIFWAVERANHIDMKNIHHAYSEVIDSRTSFDNKVIAEAKFYRELIKATHNDFLRLMEGIIFTTLLLAGRILGPDDKTNTNLKEIYSAVRDKNATHAQYLSEKFIHHTIQIINTYVIKSVA